jgi:poly-gamma-glutamate synthesis protein (capsule biosynthesis protein)
MRLVPALLVGSLILTSLSLACSSSGDSPLPSEVSLAVEPALEAPLLAVANQSLQPAGVAVSAATDAESADLAVVSVAQGERTIVVAYWVPVVQLPSPASEVSMDQLRAAVTGELSDWSEIDGESDSLRVVVASERTPPFAQWWPDVTPAVETLPVEQIAGALADDPGLLAIVPLDATTAAMRALDVDGVNIVFGTGDLASYPLVEKRWVTTRDADGEVGDVLDRAADAIATWFSVPPDPIIVRATGDIIPARCALARIEAYGDYRHPFLELAPWLREADITVGSLDSSLADISPPWTCQETFNLAAPSAAIEGFAFSGFDLLTNATNHALDCGQIGSCGADAMLATNANLRAAGIEAVGSGHDLTEAREARVLEVRGVRFGFLGYDEIATHYHAGDGLPGIAPLNEEYLRDDVAAAAESADVVVVLPQWGVEYQSVPTENQRLLAAAAAEAGAAAVIGNHPHWVQAAEVIGDTFVAYALGNFLFDQDWSLETQQGVVLELAFHPDGQGGAPLRGIRYRPVHIWDEHQPRFAEPDEARQIMDRIWDASAALD